MGLVPTDRPHDGAASLRTYTSATEAESAAAALQAAGFQCWLSPDDCGGMFPTLDAARGIQLFVGSSDAPAALAFLAAPATEPDPNVFPAPGTAAPQPPARFPLLPFITGLVVGVLLCLLYQWTDTFGTKNYRRDLNGDGRPDEVWVYVDDQVSECSIDRNFDGVVDYWDYFDTSGRRTLTKADQNYDAQPDATWTSTHGLLAVGHFDTDFNGIPDCTTTFKHELPVCSDWTPNGTNIITLRQVFRHGLLLEELRDTNFDGSFDLTIQFDPFQNSVATNRFILLSPGAR